jgi:hypothetical protein
MGTGPISEAREILMPSGFSLEQLETALRIQGLVVSLGAVYSDLLHSTIFQRPLPNYDQKDLNTYRKCLDDDEAYRMLLVFWRESPFVTDEVLNRVNLGRQFANGPLTAWGLAQELTSKVTEVGRMNSRVRAIVMAAEAFGLVERNQHRRTSKPIQATLVLHELMIALSENQYRLITELIPLLALMNVGVDEPKQ